MGPQGQVIWYKALATEQIAASKPNEAKETRPQLGLRLPSLQVCMRRVYKRDPTGRASHSAAPCFADKVGTPLN